MWFFEWLKETITGNLPLVIAFCTGVILIVVAAFVSVFLDETSVYAAFAAVIGGGMGIVVLVAKVKPKAAAFASSVLAVIGGIAYLVVCAATGIRRRILNRKERRAELKRRIQYALPERDNTFIRGRLNTVLQPPEVLPSEEEKTPLPDYKRTSGGEPVRLTYARKLLAKVQEAPLSAAERLQAEDIGKTFAMYLKKERWNGADLRAVNDTFSALLKLSAKYSVAV